MTKNVKHREIGKYENALIKLLRDKVLSGVLEKDSFIGTMLALTVNQEDPEENCKEMYDFLKKYPNAKYDDIWDKTHDILGIIIDDDDDD